jgi:HEAT repeat protein
MMRSILLSAALISTVFAGSVAAQDTLLGKNAGDWAQQLANSNDANQRRNAAFVLGKMGPRAVPVLPAMKTALKGEKDARIRDTLLFALGEICRPTGFGPDAELESLFIAALQDEDPLVRRSASYALGCLAGTAGGSRAALEKAFDSPKNLDRPEVRQNIVWALGRLAGRMEKQGTAVLPTLSKGLRDNDDLVMRDAASALLQVSDAHAVHRLVKELYPLCQNRNSEVRRAALTVLVQVVDPSDKDALPALKWAMEDKDLENKRNAALIMTNIGGPETAIALPVLLEAARNGDTELRRLAVMGIRKIGPSARAAVEELTERLRQDKDDEVRRNAALALGGIGESSAPAVPFLMEKIRDPDENVMTRMECANALQNIGPVPAAAKIVPDLLKVLVNEQQHIRVRERVMWSLRAHHNNLQNLEGPLEAFQQVIRQPVNGSNKMLRYDCAYLLGMDWHDKAPDSALDVLNDFLRDRSILLFEKVTTGVGVTGVEIAQGKATVKENFQGDGRTMATDALAMIGPARYGRHLAIMEQLRILATDKTVGQPLREKAEKLLKAVR